MGWQVIASISCRWGCAKAVSLEVSTQKFQPVHSEGDQPWDFFGGSDAEAETLVLWPPHAKSWLIGKDSDAGRDWGQEEKGTREDEMAGWDHWLDGRESVNSWSWWWTGRLGVLRFLGSQRVGDNWATELNWTQKLCVGWWTYTQGGGWDRNAQPCKVTSGKSLIFQVEGVSY